MRTIRRLRGTRFSLIMFLLGEIHQLLVSGSSCTKRSLYYKEPELAGTQQKVNLALDDIACLLDIPLWKLGVSASSKGLIAGDLKILGEEGEINCERDCVSVPADVVGIRRLESKARFILLVEKDTVFRRLLDDRVFRRLGRDVILITGKGYPDTNTRLLLKRLWDTFKIPIYSLVDADPHGIQIHFTYKFGSQALAHAADALAVPAVTWIGLLPSDMALFDIPSQPLTADDEKRVRAMLQRPFISEQLSRELNVLLETRRKAEIEGLYHFSPSYLLDEYIPNKIKRSCFARD